MVSSATERYDLDWPEGFGDLDIELWCFRNAHPPEEGGLGKAGHFRNIVDMLWNREDSMRKFIWHPWAEWALERLCEHDSVAFAGSSSSSKTELSSLWGLVNYLAAPSDTMVFFTSTSLKDSKRRIWGVVCDYWAACPGLPGRMVDSLGVIRGTRTDGSYSDKLGLALLAGDKKKERDSVGKMIGFKAKRVFFIADELPELSEGLITAAQANLSSNPYFQFVGLGNPSSYYDAFGVLCEPKDGWASITSNDDEWETKSGGVCLHFDGEKNPNMVAGEDVYPFLLTRGKIAKMKRDLGTDSPAYWRFVRGFWSPTGTQEAIYSEADIEKFEGKNPVQWRTPPEQVSFFDPAFVAGGDRAMAYFGKLGHDLSGNHTLELGDAVEIQEEMSNKEEPRNYQLVRKWRQECEQRGIRPRNAAYDWTGGGISFGDIVHVMWSPEVLGVNFGGSASDKPVSSADPTPGSQRYSNRVTELWFGGRELLRTGQLKGITTALAKEMTARLYETRKKGDQIIYEAETKKAMKARTKHSPDLADAAFGLIELCRTRFKFSSNEKEHIPRPEGAVEAKLKRLSKVGKKWTGRPAITGWRRFGRR